MPKQVPDPWLSFLRDVDRALTTPVEVHCLGGFVLSVLWGLPRVTGDLDVVDVRPQTACAELMHIAGADSTLATKYRLHFHQVTVAEYPESYEQRLTEITPGRLHLLRLKAFEIHDLVLAKLSRNSPRDRADVEFLAKQGALDRRLLLERFEAELRPHLLVESRDAQTLELWVDEFLGPEER